MKCIYSIIFAGALALFTPSIASATPDHIDQAYIQYREGFSPRVEADGIIIKHDKVTRDLKRHVRLHPRYAKIGRATLLRLSDGKRFDKKLDKSRSKSRKNVFTSIGKVQHAH